MADEIIFNLDGRAGHYIRINNRHRSQHLMLKWLAVAGWVFGILSWMLFFYV